MTQNWATGDFTTWIEQTQWRVYGVEFALQDIEGMLPIPKRDIATTRFSQGNYAPAAQCLDEVKSALGCEGAEGEALILKAARAGLVAGRCTRIAWRVSDRYGQQEENQESGVDIPDWFWEHCTSDDTAVLNWRVGRFAGRGCIDGAEYRVTISGVELSVSDIVDLQLEKRKQPNDCVRKLESLPEQGPPLPLGRRQTKSWRPWVAELVAHIHESGIPEGEGSQGQEELIKSVADALALRGIDGPGRSTVQPVVQAVLKRLRRDAEK